MNNYDAENLKKKIDSVLDAAEEFGNQSSQLANAKKDFKEYIVSLKETNDKLAKVILECNDCVESAKHIVKENEKIADAATKRVTELPDKIESIKKVVEKDHNLMMICCAASVVAAIGAIVGLFV